jgi:hypothetical protein
VREINTSLIAKNYNENSPDFLRAEDDLEKFS